MKTIISTLILLISVQSFAWVTTPTIEKEYNFKFKFEQEVFEYSTKSPSYEDAFEKAAQACFSHYKHGRRVSMERGVDIIDVCANPRSM